MLKYQRSSYTSTAIVFFFPSERNDAALAQKLRDFDQNTMVPFRRASMERIQRELRNVKVQQLPDRTHMAIAVEHLDPLADTDPSIPARAAGPLSKNPFGFWTSASDHWRRFDRGPVASGLSPTADILSARRHVSKVPKHEVAALEPAAREQEPRGR